jgi:hypothetical protein
MQQTKRRSKKGVTLFALAIALLVVALVPAAAMAATNVSIRTTLPDTLNSPVPWVAGQAGHNWVNGNTTNTYTFLTEKQTPTTAAPWVNATPADITDFHWWVDNGPNHYVSSSPLTIPTDPVVIGLGDSDGAHMIYSAAEATQTTTPPIVPAEPLTATPVYQDSVGPLWSWTLTPPDPSGDLVSPLSARWYGVTNVNFAAVASDPGGSGVATASAFFSNIGTSTPGFVKGVVSPSNPWIYNVNGTITPPTTTSTAYSTTVTLNATDTVGNHSTKSFTVNFDVWAPDTNSSVSPLGSDLPGGWTNQNVIVTFAAHDEGWGGGSLHAAGVAYTEYVVDYPTTATPDPAPPALNGSGTHGTTVTISQTAPVGPVYVYYRSVDKAVPANMEAWHLVKIYIDNNKPAIGDDVPSWWIDYGQSAPILPQFGLNPNRFHITFTATDPNSGVDFNGVQYQAPTWLPWADWQAAMLQVDGTYRSDDFPLDHVTHLTDGIYPLNYKATDNAGNVATASTQFKVDTRAPVTDGAHGWINGTVPYVLHAEDQASGAGVAATIYRVDQSTPWIYNQASTAGPVLDTPITITGTQGSWHTIDFGSADAALPYDFPLSTWDAVADGPTWLFGNLEGVVFWSHGSRTIASFTGYNTRNVQLDVTAPVTTVVVTPSDGSFPATLTFTATDDGSGVAYTEYNVDGAGWVKGNTVTVPGPGPVTVQYRSVDNVGIVEATKSITLPADSTVPVTTVSGNDDVWHNVPVTLHFSAVFGVSGGYTEWSTDGGATWTKSNIAAISQNGVITVSYRSISGSGVVEPTKSVTVKVSTTRPTITALSASVKRGHKVAIHFNITAVPPLASWVTIEIRTRSGHSLITKRYSNVTTNADMSKSIRINLPKGKYNIRVGAIDQAGNVQLTRGTGTLTVH